MKDFLNSIYLKVIVYSILFVLLKYFAGFETTVLVGIVVIYAVTMDTWGRLKK